MQPVGHDERVVAGDSAKEKRIERQAAARREIGKHRVELGLVVQPEIAARDHAREQDGGFAGLDLRDELVEVGARELRVDAAQHVIGAELQDHEIGAFAEREIDARESAPGRVARDARVNDRGVESIRAQPPLQLRGKGGVRRQH